jgi:hypothetical protein
MLYENRSILQQLRASSLSTLHEITWSAAGKRLLEVYRKAISGEMVGFGSKMLEVVN